MTRSLAAAVLLLLLLGGAVPAWADGTCQVQGQYRAAYGSTSNLSRRNGTVIAQFTPSPDCQSGTVYMALSARILNTIEDIHSEGVGPYTVSEDGWLVALPAISQGGLPPNVIGFEGWVSAYTCGLGNALMVKAADDVSGLIFDGVMIRTTICD